MRRLSRVIASAPRPVTSFDYVVLAVIGLSMLVSVVRGALREVMSIACWAVSIFLALHFAPAVAKLLPPALSNPGLRLAAAFMAILVMSLLLLGLAMLALTQLLRKSGLSATDRLLGAVFGLARALLILVALTLVAGLTALPRQPVWRNAALSPALEAAALWVRGYLPQALAARIGYD